MVHTPTMWPSLLCKHHHRRDTLGSRELGQPATVCGRSKLRRLIAQSVIMFSRDASADELATMYGGADRLREKLGGFIDSKNSVVFPAQDWYSKHGKEHMQVSSDTPYAPPPPSRHARSAAPLAATGWTRTASSTRRAHQTAPPHPHPSRHAAAPRPLATRRQHSPLVRAACCGRV